MKEQVYRGYLLIFYWRYFTKTVKASSTITLQNSQKTILIQSYSHGKSKRQQRRRNGSNKIIWYWRSICDEKSLWVYSGSFIHGGVHCIHTDTRHLHYKQLLNFQIIVWSLSAVAAGLLNAKRKYLNVG